MAYIINSDSNTLVSGTGGKDTIQNGGYDANLDWRDENFIWHNAGDNITINASTGNDKIENHYGENVKIYGGKGSDSVRNHGGLNATIYGGADNDSILNGEINAKIYGDSGNDTIYSHEGNDVTITGGKGKDFISLGSYTKNIVIKYASGDGNDTIFGFNSDDTLQITKGSYKVSTKNNDVIVKVGNGKITLKNAVGQQISIKNSSGKVTTKTYGSALLAEDNFVTAGNLSEIVSEKPVAEFENTTEKVSAENLITFAK